MKSSLDKNGNYKLDDNKLIEASGFALIEAMRWGETADTILNKSNLKSQICISALFSIELYMKSILMSNKINVKKNNYRHNIYLMYKDIDDDIKSLLKENIHIDKKVIAGIPREELIFNTFEDELKYIANDFMYLRYEYEKFLNGYSIITFTEFILSLKNNIQTIAFDYVSKKQREYHNQ